MESKHARKYEARPPRIKAKQKHTGILSTFIGRQFCETYGVMNYGSG